MEKKGSVVEENSSYKLPYLENILKNSIVHFVDPSHFTLHRFKGRQVERMAFVG
jgi:hypothetical protein